jgi:outer membrane cobalamin receptor
LFSFLRKRRSLVLLCLFFVLAIIPLGAQTTAQGDYYDEDDFHDDEYPVMEGKGITVVGTVSTTQRIETVDRTAIEKTHAADLPSLLLETLNLVITRYGPYGNMAEVNLRGFSLKRVAILVNGIPVNSAASGDFDFFSVDPGSIERIEVIHGGSDTKFNVSGALGGVINIVTVKKPEAGWSLGGSISNTSYLPGQHIAPLGETGNPQWRDLFDTQSLSVFTSGGTDKFYFRANAYGNSAGNHFLYKSYNDLTRRKEGNEILDSGASVSFLWELPDLTRLIANGAFYLGGKNVPTGGYSFVHARQKETAARENLMLEMPRAFHDDFSMEADLSHIWKNMSYDPGHAPSLHNEHTVDLINRWGWYPSSALTLRFGGDYRFIYLDSTDTGIRNGQRAGLYVTTEIRPFQNFLFVASVKGMTNALNVIAVPKLGFSWTVNDCFIIKNNYYRNFKFPDFNDLYWIQSGFLGNPDLRNEDGWGADLSVEFSLAGLLNLNSSFYGQWINDSIHWSNMSGSWRPENSGAAAFVGWENRLEFILPFTMGFPEKPVLLLSWTFRFSRLLSGDLRFGDNMRIPYMPIHTLGASLELPWKTGSVLISGHFESSRFAETANLVELDPCFLINVIYNQRLNENLSLFGKINNILNIQYVSFADYPMPGISMTLGVSMIFGGR